MGFLKYGILSKSKSFIIFFQNLKISKTVCQVSTKWINLHANFNKKSSDNFGKHKHLGVDKHVFAFFKF